MKRIIIATCSLVIIVAGTLFTGQPVFRVGEESKIRIAAVLYTESNPFWEIVWKGVREAAEGLRINLSEYQYQSNSEAESLLEIAIIADVDAIILRIGNGSSSRIRDLIVLAKERGIPIATMDTENYSEFSDVFVGINNYDSALKLADVVIEQYQHHKDILITKVEAGSSTTSVRKEAIMQRLADAGLSEVVHYLVLSGDDAMWAKAIRDSLLSNERIMFVVCTGPKSTLIAAKTIESMGLSGQIKVAGFCETREAIDYIESGVIDSLIVQKNFEMGHKTTELAYDLARGRDLDAARYEVDMLLVGKNNAHDAVKALKLEP